MAGEVGSYGAAQEKLMSKTYPIWIEVGVLNAYSGTSRFLGAGPLRMRAAVSYAEPWHGQK